MARFFLAGADLGSRREIPFEVFVALFKGIAVRSAASGDGFFELGLANDFNVAFAPRDGDDVEVVVRSTVNAGDVGSTPFVLASEGEDLNAAQIERRLFALRQIYALYVFATEGMGSELAVVARNGFGIDYEQRLLPSDFQVRLDSLGPGSVLGVASALAKRGREHVRDFFASFYPESRRALLDTARAHADLRRLQVDEKALEIDVRRANAIVDLADRIEAMPDGRVKERLRQQLNASLGSFAGSSFTAIDNGGRRKLR